VYHFELIHGTCGRVFSTPLQNRD